ncbi:MAG: polysaccharide deacetylase family protein [Nitrospirae bacterium]|nr:polysaccharide deacetylase family protein [Nitrospirota bacterium]
MFDKKFLKDEFATFAGTYFRLFKKSKLENTLTVFLFHDVTYTPSEFSRMYKLNVPPDIFDFQLKFIKNNFNVITPDELISGELPPRAAMVTFDDGVKGFFSDAVEIIENNEVPTVIFLNTEPASGVIFQSGLITYLCEKEEGFKEYLLSVAGRENIITPLFLNCTREIVNSYIKLSGKDFKDAVEGFVGPFASEEELLKTSHSRYIYYGNHLYNHDVALTLSDEALTSSYLKNMEKLQSFKNFTNLFAFPFGQPGTTFSERQIDLILSLGAQKVFSSYPVINYSPSTRTYLHRIALTDFNSTEFKTWYQIFYTEIIKNNNFFKSMKKVLQRKKPDER